MRIGRGHRDYRHIRLEKHFRKLLGRSQVDKHYGNPYISTIREALSTPGTLLKHARVANLLHKRAREGTDYSESADFLLKQPIVH